MGIPVDLSFSTAIMNILLHALVLASLGIISVVNAIRRDGKPGWSPSLPSINELSPVEIKAPVETNGGPEHNVISDSHSPCDNSNSHLRLTETTETYPDLPCNDSDSRERPPQEASGSPCDVSKCIPPAPAVGELTEGKPEAHTPLKRIKTRKINKSAAARAKLRRIKRRGKDIPCSRSTQYIFGPPSPGRSTDPQPTAPTRIPQVES